MLLSSIYLKYSVMDCRYGAVWKRFISFHTFKVMATAFISLCFPETMSTEERRHGISHLFDVICANDPLQNILRFFRVQHRAAAWFLFLFFVLCNAQHLHRYPHYLPCRTNSLTVYLRLPPQYSGPIINVDTLLYWLSIIHFCLHADCCSYFVRYTVPHQ